jgi:8-oxo-dGTP diphosphatase/putative hydrolase of the HAD superfamily
MIKNIFLDAGGVILNENYFEINSAKIISEIIGQYYKNYTIEDYWKDAEEAVYRFVPKVYYYVLYKNLPIIEEYNKSRSKFKEAEMNMLHKNYELMEGIQDFLKRFYGEYNIGILGQYGKNFKIFLEESNVLKYFTFSEIQDDYKITKPDPRYFEAILNKCNCKPAESIMVGDRIDKDIIPAKMVGMKTIRIRTGLHKNQEPRIVEEIPDLTVNKLEEIKLDQIKAMGNFA